MNDLREVFQKYAAVVFFDTETSGLDADTCQIIELAAIRIEQTDRGTLRVAKTFDDFIRLPEGEKLPEKITELTGITDEMLEKEGLDENDAVYDFEELLNDTAGPVLLAAHNAQFDLQFVGTMAERYAQPCAELTEDGLTLYSLIGDPKFLPYRQEDEVVAAQYMPLLEVLTEQQLAVLTMKAQGYTYREIAEALGLNTWRAAASTADRGRQAIRRAEDKRSDALKARTDKELGWCTPADLFRECEAYARRKLALNKLRTGDSYGENYLTLLTADTIRERGFSRYTIKRYELEAAI